MNLIDRRTFSRAIAGLPLASAAFADGSAALLRQPAAARSLTNVSTFTRSGKEERPFVRSEEGELANHDGQGYLDHMWFGGDFPHYGQTRIRIYIDHETTPSIDMELSMGAGVGFADPAAPWGTRFGGVTGVPSGIFLNYRVPFSHNVRVTGELPQGVARDTVFWWIIRGLQNRPLEVAGFDLPSNARLRLHKVKDLHTQPLDEFALCQVTGAGMVFQVTMAGTSTNLEFLEGQMRAYIDGATVPQYLSSGLEDYFLGTYYFNRGLYHLPQAGLTHKDEAASAFSGYRFHVEDPLVFSKGLRLTCRCGEERDGKIFGPTGKPKPTTYNTYAWVYEW